MSSPSDNKKPEESQPNVVDQIADTVKAKADEAQRKMGNEPQEPDHLGDAQKKMGEAKDAVVGAATSVKDAAVNAWNGNKGDNSKPQQSQ